MKHAFRKLLGLTQGSRWNTVQVFLFFFHHYSHNNDMVIMIRM